MREHEHIIRELSPAYSICEPEGALTPLVFSSPHSGRLYPACLLEKSRLDALTLRRSEDCYVDELFACAARLGAPLIAARFARAYLDANREPYELDPELFAEPLPDWANQQSVRVAGGLGTVARIVADGQEIYGAPLRLQDALDRIELLHRPYHEALSALLQRARRQFGYAVLIDCHSMPSNQMTKGGGVRPDFVLGDRFGTSCDPRLTRMVRQTLQTLGYDVHLNRPYAGGYITEHYGSPARGLNALQIEINRALYLDEATLERSEGFERLVKDLAMLVERLVREGPPLQEHRTAAE